MTYYKVVRRKNKKLYSSFANIAGYKPVRYINNKWTYPKLKNTKLFVTDDLEHAKDILSYDIHLRGFTGSIYKCEVQNPVKKEDFACTFLVDAVKLIERIA